MGLASVSVSAASAPATLADPPPSNVVADLERLISGRACARIRPNWSRQYWYHAEMNGVRYTIDYGVVDFAISERGTVNRSASPILMRYRPGPDDTPGILILGSFDAMRRQLHIAYCGQTRVGG